MSDLSSIKTPINKELKDFEPYFKESLKSDIPLLSTILKYLYRTKGKQMRPMFVFLSAKLHGETSEASLLAATSIELLHTATLVHDDVVDEAYERRGTFSINALWRNKLAVLVGDFLLAKGLLMQLDNKKYQFLHIISTAVKDMSEGEILQTKKSRKLDIDEETYYEIIRKKTASLIGSSLAIGAASVTENEDIIKKMHAIGLNAGIAFQIKDDIFDYQQKRGIGKPVGNDIKEKKITLPLLYVLNNAEKKDRKKIIKLIKHKNEEKATIKHITNLVHDNGGIDYAIKRMNEFKEMAINDLLQFPESEARASLIALVDYITTRKK